MEAERVNVLLVDENASTVTHLVRRLEEMGCQCFIARSYNEARARLAIGNFDLVLSKIKMPGGNAYGLRGLLLGRPTTLFYSHAVEDGCWWIPGVRNGSECYSEPALRPSEFFRVLGEIVREILARRSVAPPATATHAA
jgi:hypothetical protein